MPDDDLRISPAEAKDRVDSGEAMMLDVVQPATWQQLPRAVAGAIRIEPQEIAQRYHELTPEKQVIAYCT